MPDYWHAKNSTLQSSYHTLLLVSGMYSCMFLIKQASSVSFLRPLGEGQVSNQLNVKRLRHPSTHSVMRSCSKDSQSLLGNDQPPTYLILLMWLHIKSRSPTTQPTCLGCQTQESNVSICGRGSPYHSVTTSCTMPQRIFFVSLTTCTQLSN